VIDGGGDGQLRVEQGHSMSQIRHFMTESAHAIGCDQNLKFAHDRMQQFGIHQLPVLEGGVLVGVLSERDIALIRAVSPGQLETIMVEEAMAAEPYAVAASDDIAPVVAHMVEHKYGMAVVMDHNKVSACSPVWMFAPVVGDAATGGHLMKEPGAQQPAQPKVARGRLMGVRLCIDRNHRTWARSWMCWVAGRASTVSTKVVVDNDSRDDPCRASTPPSRSAAWAWCTLVRAPQAGLAAATTWHQRPTWTLPVAAGETLVRPGDRRAVVRLRAYPGVGIAGPLEALDGTRSVCFRDHTPVASCWRLRARLISAALRRRCCCRSARTLEVD
jgi:CBS domain-containing protein